MLDAAVQMFSVNGYHETSMDVRACSSRCLPATARSVRRLNEMSRFIDVQHVGRKTATPSYRSPYRVLRQVDRDVHPGHQLPSVRTLVHVSWPELVGRLWRDAELEMMAVCSGRQRGSGHRLSDTPTLTGGRDDDQPGSAPVESTQTGL